MSTAYDLLTTYLSQQIDLGMPGVLLTDALPVAPLKPIAEIAPLDPIPQTKPTASTSLPGAPRLTPVNFPPIPKPVRPIPAVASSDAFIPHTSKRSRLAALMQENSSCTSCGLHATRTQVIFGSGSAQAQVVIIGDAPSREDDTAARPFTGAIGELLTKMLAAIGLDRDKDVFITNILKCAPPDEHEPTETQSSACMQLLKKQIEIIDPKAILIFGTFAARTLLATKEKMADMHGRIATVYGHPALVTYHPSALMHNATFKRPTWEDLKKLATLLKQE